MTQLSVPNDGVQGIDIERPDGSKARLDADKSGRVSVDDPQLVSKLKQEGFTVNEISMSLIGAKGYPCIKCGFSSVFRIYTCPKCETKNGEPEPDQAETAEKS
mgnify:CR=1 FL=1